MIFTIIERCRRKARHVRFALPVYLLFKKGLIMSNTLTLQNDARAVVKLVATDAIGAPIAVPPGTITISDSTVATAALNPDGTVTIDPVAPTGTATITYTVAGEPSLVATADIVIVTPAAASVSFDTANAVLSPKVQAAPATATMETAAPAA